MTKLQKFKAKMLEKGFDAAIISSYVNIRYITNFDYQDGYVLVTKGKSYVITDFRYIEAARATVDQNDFELVMPDTVKSIGSSAFSGCTALEKLTLSKNLESIGRSAFSNCDALEELVLPVSLKSIVTYGLNSMDGEIHYEGTVTQWVQVQKNAAGGTLNKVIHCADGDVQP